ncbi:MAG: outer membrane protein assembly factor BamB [Burkholderiales bacterium]|nr:outer membrane protein assembly factor BamB [Burkholderiales bacterium]
MSTPCRVEGHRARGLALALAAAAALGLGGCSGFSWNPLRWFDPAPTQVPAPLPPITGQAAVSTLWQASVGDARGAAFAPAVAAGSVFAAGGNGTVARFDERSGRELWRTDVASPLSGGVGSDGRLVVVGTTEGEVIALEAGGELRWRARVSSEVLAPPEVAGDLVVVRSADSRVFGLEARDGRRRWAYQRQTPSLAVRSPAGISVSSGFVFAGFPGGKLVALAQSNGGLRWEGTVSLPRGTTELERMSDVTGNPWVGDRVACAVAHQGRAACFDLANGVLLWAREMSSSVGLAVDGRAVYVSEDRGAVSALAASSGTSLWRQDKLQHRRLTAPLPLERELAVGDVEGYVHLLARDTGAFVGRLATDGSPIRSAPVPIAGGFLVQTSRGGLFAYGQK